MNGWSANLLRSFYVFLFTCIVVYTKAQQNVDLNRAFDLPRTAQNAFIPLDDNVTKSSFSSFKPCVINPVFLSKSDSGRYIVRKLFRENFVMVRDSVDAFSLNIDPLFNLELGRDLADESGERIYTNTRGVRLQGQIGAKFYFETAIYENQSTFMSYIDEFIDSSEIRFAGSKIIPGQGRAKDFKEGGYDYTLASGYVSYSPRKFINIQIGHGKHFVGDGYRSLLLSDNAHNYPYTRITTNVGRFQYTNLYTVFMNMTNGGVPTPPTIEPLYQKKVGSYQMLSCNVTKRLNISLFQGLIWQVPDSTNRQKFNVNTFNPIIGINSLIYGLGASNNVLLGGTANLKVSNKLSVYGQLVVDDIHTSKDNNKINSKYGAQLGAKYFEAFGLPNLVLQGEVNVVRPYTYGANEVAQSYTHFNQALTHPMGANFKELVGFVNYRYKRLFTQLKVNYAKQGLSQSGFNAGADPFVSTSSIGVQGSEVKRMVTYQDLHVGYLFNNNTNLSVLLGVVNRINKLDDVSSNTGYVYFGFRTSLRNMYYDF